jgi:hypothetical protein
MVYAEVKCENIKAHEKRCLVLLLITCLCTTFTVIFPAIKCRCVVFYLTHSTHRIPRVYTGASQERMYRIMYSMYLAVSLGQGEENNVIHVPGNTPWGRVYRTAYSM